MNWRGDYVFGSTYYEDQGVAYEGSSYICTADELGTTNVPTGDDWNLLALKGEIGSQGP